MKDKTILDISTIVKQYNDDKMSTYEIAEYHGTYPQKIKRVLQKAGVTLRDRSESQSVALKNGRKSHPTAGVGHSDEAKVRISEAISSAWRSQSDEEKEEKVNKARERWLAIPEEQRASMTKRGHDANREAATHGSKIERLVHEYLMSTGYVVTKHRVFKIPGHVLEVDLYLAKENIAIEIDGPSHFLPIWGEEKLRQTIKADETKNAQLLGGGIKILRLKNLTSTLSDKVIRDMKKNIDDGLKRLMSGENFIEIEVSV